MGKRFVTEFAATLQPEYLETITRNFFASQGFSMVQYKGEYVWRKGTGLVTAPQFIKLGYINGVVRIEAWLKGPFGGEMGLTGFVGAIPKSMLKGVVDNLVGLLRQPQVQTVPIPQPPVQPQIRQ